MLIGQRVLLRATKRDDLYRQWEFENPPELWRLDGGPPRPTTLEPLLADFGKATHSDGSNVSFAIEADNTYIGHGSLHNFNAVNRTCELSVEIGDSAYWGRGYGRETVRMLLDYAFRHRNLHRVWLRTHSENERAIRCYRACGFVEEGRLRQHIWIDNHYVDAVCMGIIREEFELLKPV